MPTLQQSLAQAAQALEAAGVADARLSAEVLLTALLGRERSYLYAYPEDPLPAGLASRWYEWIAERARGVPQQYLLGEQEFFGRPFRVSPAVLIPRPETELVVEAALEKLPDEAIARVVDVGTGSGCIAVTLGLEQPQAEVFATDISSSALAVARENAARLGARITFVETDLLDDLSGPFDLIVSNPPYLTDAELAAAAVEVREHEPASALASGPTGNECYARLIPAAAARLRAGGWLVLELGYASAPAVRRMLAPELWDAVETRRDLQGWERVLLARRA